MFYQDAGMNNEGSIRKKRAPAVKKSEKEGKKAGRMEGTSKYKIKRQKGKKKVENIMLAIER